MNPKLQRLFEAVRSACKPARWSRGVELVRGGRVRFEREDADEIQFQVVSGRMASRRVTLFPDDEEWDCACSLGDEPCEHVAAAVITWKRAGESGREVSATAAAAARVGYRLSRAGGAVALRRVVVAASEEEPLRSTLAAIAAGRTERADVIASQADLAVDLLLGTHRDGPVPPNLVPKLFGRLAHCADVRLDDEPVSVAADPVLPVLHVEDQEDGFRLTLREDPGVVERFSNGVARCGSVLRPMGDPGLNAREREQLPRGRRFGPDEVGELLTAVLPALRRRVPVEIHTRRLPETDPGEKPRVRIETERRGERLDAFATLVYGDPPRSRIDAGRLVHLDGPVPVRDEKAERRWLERLQRELGLLPGVRAEFQGVEAVAFTRRLERWSEQLTGRGHEAFRLAPPLRPVVETGQGRFDVRFASEELAVEGRRSRAGLADPWRVLQAWRSGESLVPLLEGGWAPLPLDWLERHGHRVADLLAARAEQGSLPRAALPDLAALCEELDLPPPPEFASLRRLVESFEGIPRASLPEDLAAELREYQRHGVDWLCFLRQARLGALLADDMGLGKTLQALCAVRGRTLVVAPTSVLHNWADEARRFRPALRVNVFHGQKRRLDADTDLTLTTYAILRLDADRLAAERWKTVVLDEAQAIKNPESRVAAAAFRLQAEFRIALTGTPVENRLDELWSQFHFINRSLLGGRTDFQERYAGPIAAGEAEAARRLRERIRPFLLRRLKRDVAPELPPRTDVVLRCELGEEERAVYDAVHTATREDVVQRLERGSAGALAALEALLRLRQAACHAGLVPGASAAGSAKLDLLLESLDSVVAEGHKALIFSQWTSLLDLTEPALRGGGIDFVRLDGSTRDRAGVVARFQSIDGPPVLLVSLKAGGTGLNLTAADHIFLLDPWWNPAAEDQAADRAHRIGQQRPVLVHRLVATDTVEERILDLQRRKRDLADVVLGEGDQAAGITRQELLELLR